MMLLSETKWKSPHGSDRHADSRVRVAGLRTLQLEIAAMHALADELMGALGPSYDAAAALIRKTTGRLIISGVG